MTSIRLSLLVACIIGLFAVPLTIRGNEAVDCSEPALRAAIQAGGSIDLTSNCVYSLTADLPTIAADLAINGHDAVIDGGHYSLFEADGKQTISLKSVVVKNGQSIYGGGLFAAAGIVLISDSTFSGNTASFGGGAIYAGSGTVTITGSTFDGNTADFGGAVASSSGNVTSSNSTYSKNTAGSRGGGGIWAQQGAVTVDSSTFVGNTAGNKGGGGIYVGSGEIAIRDSTFTDNSTPSGKGGGVEAEFAGPGFGGNSGIATVARDTFSGNKAADGGAVYITNASSLTVTQTTFAQNVAIGDGGAVLADAGEFNIINSTFAANQATNGGGLASYRVAIFASTFSENTAKQMGGAIYTQGNLILGQSIVAGNQAPTGTDISLTQYATYDFRGYNLIGVNDIKLSMGKSNIIDPKPGLVTFDGRSYLLAASSPALDAIPPDTCATQIDLRGIPRPQGTGCDIGAVEMPVAGKVIATVTPSLATAESLTSTPTRAATIACTEQALREALQKGGTVYLAQDCTYLLSSDLAKIAPGTEIVGNGAIIDGTEKYRVLPQSGGIMLHNLSLKNGLQDGKGAVYRAGWTTAITDYKLPLAVKCACAPMINAQNADELLEFDHAAPFKYTEAMVFSPDSTMLAVGASNVTTVFDVSAGKLTPKWTLPIWSESLAFSPDGNMLATADLSGQGYDINLRNAHSGELLQTLRGHQDSIYHLAFSADGTFLASSDRQSIIKLWDLKTNMLITDLRGQRGVEGLSFSQDGKYLISAGDGIRLWDLKTYDPEKVFDAHIADAAFISDKNIIASGSNFLNESGAVQLYDSQNGELRASLQVDSQTIWKIAFSSNGQVMAGLSVDSYIIFWDMATLQPIAVWNKAPKLLEQATFSPNGTLFAVSTRDENGEVWLWGLPQH